MVLCSNPAKMSVMTESFFCKYLLQDFKASSLALVVLLLPVRVDGDWRAGHVAELGVAVVGLQTE